MTLDLLLKQVHLTKGVSDVITFGSGIIKGYCDSQGISINPKILKESLILGPLIIQTGAGAYNGLIEGISEHESYSKNSLKGGIMGLGLGALELGIGYCIGYTIGGISK